MDRNFVLHRKELASLEIQRTIKSQLDDGVKVHVALREDLRFSGGLGTGEGIEEVTNFVLFDHRKARLFGPLCWKSIMGEKVRLPSELARLERMYRILHQHASSAEEALRMAPASVEIAEEDPVQSHLDHNLR
ncbi:MAG: hypothetical protein AB1555_15560 [Nitrospirota bacterium]